MIICAAGDNHGAIDRLFHDILTFESAFGLHFDWILHVGDLGIWPDETRIDKATRKHDGAGDFPTWFNEKREVPRRTVFVKGNHEDFVWLGEQQKTEILPGLFYLENGQHLEIAAGDQTILVGGVGGCFGPSDYHRRSGSLQGYANRHYTREEIDLLVSRGTLDILLVHDAPAGVTFERHRKGRGWVSDAGGLDVLIRETRPRVCFFGHHHTRLDSEIHGVPCIGLNKVRCPGNLVAVEMPTKGRGFHILGEWPEGD